MKGLRASISLVHAIATFWTNSGVCWVDGRTHFMMSNLLAKICLISSLFSSSVRTNPCSHTLLPKYFL